MAETIEKEIQKMKRWIKKAACAVMAITLIAGIFTGCKAATAAMPDYTSVTEQPGGLPEKGKVGDMEYRVLGKGQMGSYNKPRGYYFDQLEQLNSPIFIIISAGTQTRTGGELKIKDLGMQGSKLVIVVEETKAAGDKYTGLDCPTAALEVDHEPSEVLIVSTKGEQFNKIEA
jgi:hypothetical protein